MYKMGSVDGMVSLVDHRRRETGSGMPSLIFFSKEYYPGISLSVYQEWNARLRGSRIEL